MEEPLPNLPWATFVMGTMPAWWSHAEDNRASEPFIGLTQWQKELAAAGYADLDHLNPDREQRTTSVMTARVRVRKQVEKRITLLCNSKESLPSGVLDELTARGFRLDLCSLGQKPPHAQDILAFLV